MTVQRRPATEAEAKALASAIRLRILRLCLDEALTNKQLAAKLDANPATVLHHVRTLVATGFLTPQPERRGPRSAREIPYLATGKSWTLSIDDAPSTTQAMLAAFTQEIALVKDLSNVEMARLGLRLTDSTRAELVRRLNELLDEFRERASTLGPGPPEGDPYSFFYALHPDVDREPR